LRVKESASARAQATLRAAGLLLDQLEHEKAVKIMTEFLRSASGNNEFRSDKSEQITDIAICLACGGSAKRWANFLETPKHLVDIGKTHALLEHTKSQLLSRMSITGRVKVIVDKNYFALYQSVSGIDLIFRQGDPEEDVALEVLSNPEIGLESGKNLLLLMGDVAFTESAMDQIAQAVLSGHGLKVFGRSRMNEKHGNTGGEIFGAYVPYKEIGSIRAFYDACKRIYYGTSGLRMYRYSTWEVLALVSAAAQISGEETLMEISRHPYSLRELLPAMKSTFDRGQFHQAIWHEIDDETEDFDFPCEYLQWLIRSIEKHIQSQSSGVAVNHGSQISL